MKIYYFDVYGRAEALRFLLTHAKVEYENVNINKEKMEEMTEKGELEFGLVPVVEHDGKFYNQSAALLRMLGRKYGYYDDKDIEGCYLMDSFASSVEDTFERYYKVMQAKSDEERKEIMTEFVSNYFPKWLSKIEKRLEVNGSEGHLVGDKYTIIDFGFASILFSVIYNEAHQGSAHLKPIYEQFPRLTKYAAALRTDFESYLKSRPQPRPI